MRTWTAWKDKDGACITLTGGTAPRDPDCAQPMHRIEAETWEEAMAIHHLRMGWEPYAPIGPQAGCPRCGSVIYDPDGSGQCWKCEQEKSDNTVKQ